jgi:hypothetical protein
MKFVRWVFLVAGIYGLIVITPLYFMEGVIGRETPPPLNHPAFFYGSARRWPGRFSSFFWRAIPSATAR